MGVVGLIFDDWLVCAEIPHGQQLVEGVNQVRPFFYDRMYFVIPPLVANPSGQTLIEFGLNRFMISAAMLPIQLCCCFTASMSHKKLLNLIF